MSAGKVRHRSASVHLSSASAPHRATSEADPPEAAPMRGPVAEATSAAAAAAVLRPAPAACAAAMAAAVAPAVEKAPDAPPAARAAEVAASASYPFCVVDPSLWPGIELTMPGRFFSDGSLERIGKTAS